jgi:hypothetical protein
VRDVLVAVDEQAVYMPEVVSLGGVDVAGAAGLSLSSENACKSSTINHTMGM